MQTREPEDLPWCDRCEKFHATAVSVELAESWCDGCVKAAGGRGGFWRDLPAAAAARTTNEATKRSERA